MRYCDRAIYDGHTAGRDLIDANHRVRSNQMFRLICLVQTVDDAPVDDIVIAARKMVADEPRIIRGEVMAGLGK